jgi:hypothetical protein
MEDQCQQLHMQSVPITTKVVSSNPVHGELYSICDKVYQWLATGQLFSPGTPVSSTNKTYCHYITVIFFVFCFWFCLFVFVLLTNAFFLYWTRTNVMRYVLYGLIKDLKSTRLTHIVLSSLFFTLPIHQKQKTKTKTKRKQWGIFILTLYRKLYSKVFRLFVVVSELIYWFDMT